MEGSVPFSNEAAKPTRPADGLLVQFAQQTVVTPTSVTPPPGVVLPPGAHDPPDGVTVVLANAVGVKG
jgi:hypothetical protein